MTRAQLALLVFLAGGAALAYWIWDESPKETQIKFILTGVEMPYGQTLLRHNDITRLNCDVVDDDGETVANPKPRSGSDTAAGHPQAGHLHPENNDRLCGHRRDAFI
jgi:hypothetical protein